ncbi:MAG: phage Gp37/Gp68 family protein [Candidatus Thiodiazotropha sp.]
MGRNSKIEWTHHTFNPWWGCVKISPACKYCYAEGWAKRVGKQVWGSGSERRFFTDQHWNEPRKWDREALLANERKRVFCASMADVFEARKDLNPWRKRLWSLIEETPNLDWLLLSKRPQRFATYLPWSSLPKNIWLGTTVENQTWSDKRIDHLMAIDASVRFLSCEPLLGRINLRGWIENGLDWVIAGGESGPKARPTSPAWIRYLRDQCLNNDVPFHFKQWGHWAPEPQESIKNVRHIAIRDDETGPETVLWALGKNRAGRLLDGRVWDGVPN